LGGAAAAAGVAAGLLGPRAAHAAPVPTGGPFILGQANDANNTTSLTATTSTTPDPILDVAQPNPGYAVRGHENSGAPLSVGLFGTSDKSTSPAGAGDGAGIGVWGQSGNNTGVAGASTSGKAVAGTSGSGYGVFGQSTSSNGVFGLSTSDSGVNAHSINHDGLFAVGGRFGASLQGSTAPLYLGTSGFIGAPTSGTHITGEVMIDNNGDMFLCVKNGSPGGWRQVAAPQVGYAGGALNLLPVPIRLLDTRAGATVGNTRPGAPVGYHGTINVPAAGVTYQMQTIPSGATAVFGLLTAALAPGVNCGDGSSAIAYATGATRPAAVNVVFNPQDAHGAYTSDFTLVATGASGEISIYNQPINVVAVDYLFDCFGFVM
jgi:hypothetical protein